MTKKLSERILKISYKDELWQKNERGRRECLSRSLIDILEKKVMFPNVIFLLKYSTANLNGIVGKKKGVIEVLLKSCRRFCQCRYKFTTQKFIRNPARIMKLESPHFKSCITEEVIILQNLFIKNGHEIRIVGGAVRDLLMGIQPLDLDFSTTATPIEMKQMFEENNFRLINTKGEKHGTITTRINDKNFEVTSLRIDLATDGRHAVVEFTKDWVLDANRRDLTINAMYLGLDGTLYDYFNGYEDLKNKRLVFVGDAASRIQEDYLRILRYFRFYGRIAETPDNHDEDVLKAIEENAEGLQNISGERIWIELNKIFQGKFAGNVILKMLSLGIGPYIGIPKKYNENEFRRVWDRLKMNDEKTKPMTVLSALFGSTDELNDFYARLKPSNAERDLGYFILNNREEKIEPNSLRKYQILLINSKFKHEFTYELLKYQGKYDLLEKLKKWNMPVFPVNGHALKSMGMKGKEVGEVLSYLKQIWCENDFNISEKELLTYVSKKKKIKLEK